MEGWLSLGFGYHCLMTPQNKGRDPLTGTGTYSADQPQNLITVPWLAIGPWYGRGRGALLELAKGFLGN